MKLIILLVCILLQTFNITLFRHHYQFFDHYVALINPLLNKLGLERGWGAIIGLLVPVLIVVYVLGLLFAHVGLLYLLFGLLILMICLDVRDAKTQLTDYFSAINSENSERIQAEVEKFTKQSVGRDRSLLIRILTGAIFVQSVTNIFSVIFWFMLLGPFGAMLYYLVAAVSERVSKSEDDLSHANNAASYLKDILDWIPVRLVSFTYALIGHFAPVFTLWLQQLGNGPQANSTLLIDAGLLALDIPKEATLTDVEENYKALSLVNRTLWTWVIVIAVLNITSWLF